MPTGIGIQPRLVIGYDHRESKRRPIGLGLNETAPASWADASRRTTCEISGACSIKSLWQGFSLYKSQDSAQGLALTADDDKHHLRPVGKLAAKTAASIAQQWCSVIATHVMNQRRDSYAFVEVRRPEERAVTTGMLMDFRTITRSNTVARDADCPKRPGLVVE